MTPKRRRWSIVGAVAGASAVAIVLVVLVIPIRQESSGYQLLGPHLYAYESESIFGATSWSNFSYRGGSFSFQVDCAPSPPPPGPSRTICGAAAAPGGPTSNFTFFEPEVPSVFPTWQSWVSPSGTIAVDFDPGGIVRLMVAL
jgi:hypothetical protein